MDAGVWFRTLRDLPAPLALPTPAGQTSSSRSSREKRIDGFYASGVCVVCGGQRRGKGWWLVVGKSTKKGGMVDGRVGWCHQSTHPSTTLCVACSATMWSIHQSIPTTHTPHTGDGWDGGVVDEGMRGV